MEEPLSKSALKKLEKERLKQEQKAKNLEQQNQAQAQQLGEDYSSALYGDFSSVPLVERTDKIFTKIQQIDESLLSQSIIVRARLHNSRVKGNIGFMVLRDSFYSVQCVASKNEQISKQMINFMKAIPNESIVELTALVTKPEVAVEACSQKQELQIQSLFVVNRARTIMPFQIYDASQKIDKRTLDEAEESTKNDNDEENKQINVSMKTRLDYRILDLRTPGKQAIFRLQAGVCQLFREYCYQNDFVEIHTPKLIGGSSEGGSNVFNLEYFGKQACLAQSPQLYKQMCVQGDFQRVFEVGHVFRAENSHTHRHLCEFTGLDLEMTIKQSYHEVMDFCTGLFLYIFQGLETRFAKELAAINEQFAFEPFKFVDPVPRLTFEEGCELLKENGIEWSKFEDLSTEVERKLGHFVKQKYGTDFYFLHRYPKTARPFYTMPQPDDPDFTCSYDFFMRGEEITSGAQRIHDPEMLAKSATEKGIDINTIKDYIDAFTYGAYPHGGCGIGLERVVMLYCDLKNIRNSSMFPRDPCRITP